MHPRDGVSADKVWVLSRRVKCQPWYMYREHHTGTQTPLGYIRSGSFLYHRDIPISTFSVEMDVLYHYCRIVYLFTTVQSDSGPHNVLG